MARYSLRTKEGIDRGGKRPSTVFVDCNRVPEPVSRPLKSSYLIIAPTLGGEWLRYATYPRTYFILTETGGKFILRLSVLVERSPILCADSIADVIEVFTD